MNTMTILSLSNNSHGSLADDVIADEPLYPRAWSIKAWFYSLCGIGDSFFHLCRAARRQTMFGRHTRITILPNLEEGIE